MNAYKRWPSGKAMVVERFVENKHIPTRCVRPRNLLRLSIHVYRRRYKYTRVYVYVHSSTCVTRLHVRLFLISPVLFS